MANIPSAVLPKSVLASDRHKTSAIRVSPVVVESAAMDAAGVYARLEHAPGGIDHRRGRGASGRARPQRAGQGPAAGTREAALARGAQSAGDPAGGARDDLVRDRRFPGRRP